MKEPQLQIDDLSRALTSTEIEHLRRGYDPDALIALKVQATSGACPPLEPWASAIGSTFFGAHGLAARERELCLITLLAYRAPSVSLSTHVYAGLMEGLAAREICYAIGLSGCYGGLPAYTEAVAVVRTTFGILKLCAAGPNQDVSTILTALVAGFSNRSS